MSKIVDLTRLLEEQTTASLRARAAGLRQQAAGLERTRFTTRGHRASLTLDFAVRLRGAARAAEALADEIDHPSPDDDPHPGGDAA